MLTEGLKNKIKMKQVQWIVLFITTTSFFSLRIGLKRLRFENINLNVNLQETWSFWNEKKLLYNYTINYGNTYDVALY